MVAGRINDGFEGVPSSITPGLCIRAVIAMLTGALGMRASLHAVIVEPPMMAAASSARRSSCRRGGCARPGAWRWSC